MDLHRVDIRREPLGGELGDWDSQGQRSLAFVQLEGDAALGRKLEVAAGAADDAQHVDGLGWQGHLAFCDKDRLKPEIDAVRFEMDELLLVRGCVGRRFEVAG